MQKLLERILNRKIRSLNYHENEKSIAINPEKKSVRLDIFVETEEGLIIDVEMQTSNKKAKWLPKRTRYYQALIDSNTLSKGTSYRKLPESYIVFICTFDPFDKCRKVYTFTNKCHEDNLELDDGSTKIFFNTKGNIGDIDEDVSNFLKYI